MPTSTSSPARKEFDYTILDTETSRFVQQQTGEILGLMKRTAQSIVEIGLRLISVKERLGHGRFGDWLEAEFGWNKRTAQRFMVVAEQFGDKCDKLSQIELAPSALYILAAPSTPSAVREEAIARALAGELITHKTAKALKQKYASSPQNQITSPPSQSGSKLEIVTIRSAAQAVAPSAQSVNLEGVWWQLGGRHLLYCGHPNSDEFIARLPENVQLLLAFPPARIWQSRISADARIILSDYLPIFQNPQLLDETLETLILNYSRLGDLVVTCYLPSQDILCVLNRLSRRGLLAEPDSRRCNAIVADWNRAGLKAERVS